MSSELSPSSNAILLRSNARSIMLVLINESPENTDWQQTLVSSHERVGDVLRDQGDLAAALAEYHAELDIDQRLAEKDPDNTDRQLNLSVSHNKVGDVQHDQGDLTAALAEYRA